MTPGLFARARTPEQMARLTPYEIEALIPGIFLAKRKAKALRGMAEILVNEHGGQVPRDPEALEELPGVAFVEAAVKETTLPTFAIGGIGGDNIAAVVAAGARRVAVGHAVAQANDPRAAAAALLAALPR